VWLLVVKKALPRWKLSQEEEKNGGFKPSRDRLLYTMVAPPDQPTLEKITQEIALFCVKNITTVA
jgi:hypothetical protein